jgi:hypothetical protein
MPCAPVPNGLGRTGFPFSLSWWLRRSCRWSGCGLAGSLTLSVSRSGLGAPMPTGIHLVLAGRWRPSPGRVAEGAPSDHDARGLVPGGLPGGGAGGALPVLGAPPGGVGGVDGDDRDALLSGHGNKPGPQAGGREPGDQAPELLTATVFSRALSRGLPGRSRPHRTGGPSAGAWWWRAGSGRPDGSRYRTGRRRSGGVRRQGCRAGPGARPRSGRGCVDTDTAWAIALPTAVQHGGAAAPR